MYKPVIALDDEVDSDEVDSSSIVSRTCSLPSVAGATSSVEVIWSCVCSFFEEQDVEIWHIAKITANATIKFLFSVF
jgi:hypothetical protein